jgi:hypothetical protein
MPAQCYTRDQSLLVAGAAPARLIAAGNRGGSKTEREVVVHSPWGLVGARVGDTARLAAGLGVEVSETLEVGVAGEDRLVHGSLLGPAARRLAAVPVAGGLAISGKGQHRQGGHNGGAEEGGGTHLDRS